MTVVSLLAAGRASKIASPVKAGPSMSAWAMGARAARAGLVVAGRS
jgi:hypothetical protein